MTDTELIYPGELPMGAVAAALLKLADHPHDVDWQPRMGAFIVPSALAQKYAAVVAGEPEPAAAKGPAKAKGARKRTTAKKGATSEAPRRARRGSRDKGTTSSTTSDKTPQGGGDDA